MARTLLVRGMLAGLAAGLLAFVVAKLFGEGPIGYAIAFESAHDTAGSVEPELVSRTVQSTLGLATAVLAFGTAVGGLYGLAYAYVQGRFGSGGARPTAAVVALCGFLALYLLPTLKYPANPPSVGNPDTIGRRTTLYFLMVAVALVAVVGAAIAARALARRIDAWNAALLGIGGGLLLVLAAYLLLPDVHEVPPDFPADVLWNFRIASLAVQATAWATLGVVFGTLTHRSAMRSQLAPPTPATGTDRVA
jgi:Probable cobalt transporter subunit (CbtA)